MKEQLSLWAPRNERFHKPAPWQSLDQAQRETITSMFARLIGKTTEPQPRELPAETREDHR